MVLPLAPVGPPPLVFRAEEEDEDGGEEADVHHQGHDEVGVVLGLEAAVAVRASLDGWRTLSISLSFSL